MLRLPPFRYVAPANLREAVEILAAEGDGAVAMAGGTDLIPGMKRRQVEPGVVVGIRHLPELQGIRGDAHRGAVIGAACSLTEIHSHPMIRQHYPGLASAAAQVATPQVRNMGTIGGNLCVDTRCNYYNMPYTWRRAVNFCLKKDGKVCLVAPGSSRCWAIASSDIAPVLIVLDARLLLVSYGGERTIRAEELYRDDGIRFLTKDPGEVIVEIHLPPSGGLRTTYWKVRRRGSFDFPVLSVAIALRKDHGGSITDARIALGAVRSFPFRVGEAERVLRGERLTPEVIEAASEAAYRAARPLDNADLAYFWRKRMVKVFMERALRTFA